MPHAKCFAVVLSVLVCFSSQGIAQQSRWGSPDDDTVKFMTTAEARWASSRCSPQPDLTTLIADDFQGTATDGQRYGKEEAIATDADPLSRNCQLGDVTVRFFGESVAIAYGSESRVLKAKDTKRCQVWTDTWLKREGQWQVVAAQDTIVPCNP